jgi:hypothetical protein
MNLTHRKAIEWLECAKDGRLDEPDRWALEEHLAGCEACRWMAALDRRLAWDGQALPRSTRRLTDRGLIQAVLRQKRRQQLVWGPLQGLAWAAVAVLLVGMLSWSIGSLRSIAGVNLVPVGAGQGGVVEDLSPEISVVNPPPPGIFRQGVITWIEMAMLENSEWVFEHFFIAGMLPVLLVGLVGVFLGTRQAETTWLAFLLGVLALGAGFLVLSVRLVLGNFVYSLVTIPFLVAVMAMLAVHLWSTPALWTRWTAAILAAWGVGLALLVTGPWYGPEENMSLSRVGFWLILGAGLVPAILWQGWARKGRGRAILFLILAFSLVGPVTTFLVYFSADVRSLPWLGTMASIGDLLWPVLTTILAARLVFAWLSGPRPVTRGRWLWGAAGWLLLWGGLFAHVRAWSILNRVDDDHLLGTFLLFLVSVTALMACVAIAWRMTGRRMWAALVLVLGFALAQVPAARVPYEVPEQVTAQRAGQINREILRYHEDTGGYPAALEDLSPRYLLAIPRPVSLFLREWCYDGGESYYRLGYAIPVHFSYPGDLDVRLYASAGEIPEREMPCWEALRVIQEKYP